MFFRKFKYLKHQTKFEKKNIKNVKDLLPIVEKIKFSFKFHLVSLRETVIYTRYHFVKILNARNKVNCQFVRFVFFAKNLKQIF